MWTEILLLAVGGVLGSLGQIFVARFSKTKRERDAALADVYLKLADMSAEQLEERINYIGKLAGDNQKQREEIDNLRKKQTERDETIVSIQARMTALQLQIEKDAQERNKLREKLSEFEVKNRVLWQYIIALLEQFKAHNIIPVDPPDGLTSDPEIMRLIDEIKKNRER